MTMTRNTLIELNTRTIIKQIYDLIKSENLTTLELIKLKIELCLKEYDITRISSFLQQFCQKYELKIEWDDITSTENHILIIEYYSKQKLELEDLLKDQIKIDEIYKIGKVVKS